MMLIVQKGRGLENEQKKITELKGMKEQRKTLAVTLGCSHKKNNEERSEIKKKKTNLHDDLMQ